MNPRKIANKADRSEIAETSNKEIVTETLVTEV